MNDSGEDEDSAYLRRAIISWEIMRLVFSCGIAATLSAHRTSDIIVTAFALMIFNIFYCLGPAADCLLCVQFRFRLGFIRYLMAPITLLSLVLVLRYFWPTFRFVGMPVFRMLAWCIT